MKIMTYPLQLNTKNIIGKLCNRVFIGGNSKGKVLKTSKKSANILRPQYLSTFEISI